MSKPAGTIRNCATGRPWDGTGYLVPCATRSHCVVRGLGEDYFYDDIDQVWERVHNLATTKYLEEKNHA